MPDHPPLNPNQTGGQIPAPGLGLPERPAFPSVEIIRNGLRQAKAVDAPADLQIESMAGNPDRRDYLSRGHFRVCTGARTLFHLTIGRDLSQLRERTGAFANACPEIACRPLFHHRFEEWDYLGIEFFEGENLERLARDGRLTPAEVLRHGERIVAALEKTLQPSNRKAAEEEIDLLFKQVCSLPIFAEFDQALLQQAVFPFVRDGALAGPYRTRWTNGDLIPRNVLVDPQDNLRLVDYEFAARTHFFAEDGWRWHRFSSLPTEARDLPGTSVGETEKPWLAAFCFLRQLVLTHEINGDSKAVMDSLAAIERLIPLVADNHAAFRLNLFLQVLASTPKLRAALEQQGRAIAEFEERLRQKDLSIAEKDLSIAEKDQVIDQQNQTITQKNQVIDQKDQAIAQQNQTITQKEKFIHEKDLSIAQTLALGRVVTNSALGELTRLRDLLYQREEKIRAMQASFSWQSTTPLRALRRTLLDRDGPKPGPPPDPARIPVINFNYSPQDFEHAVTRLRYSFDRPRSWSTLDGQMEVRGWCFALDQIILKAVRARVGDRIFPGIYGLPRADVAAHHPEYAQSAHCGFKLELTLEPKGNLVVIDVGDEEGKWHHLLTCRLGGNAPDEDYNLWIRTHDALTPEAIARIQSKSQSLRHRPLISVLMPVYNPPEQWLKRAIESVRSQIYDRWELCIADDASTAAHIRPLLEKAAREDPRIKVVFRETNGHAPAASNSALELATGKFAALLDHDDELAPHALLCCAEVMLAQAGTEVIYSDEDKIDEQGRRFDPYFKPDWSPDLLTSQNYFSHLCVYRTATLRAIGGFRPGFEGSQAWDVALRIVERIPPQHIHHIPRVLYHGRAIGGSGSMPPDEKNATGKSARKALEEHFARVGQKVSLHVVRGGHWHIQYPRPEPPPLVTLIIPTRNRRTLLATCVESIFARTSYPNFEILVADNDSDDPELADFYERMKAGGRFNVLPCPGPFNFSAINNRAVSQAGGKIIGLLNNDLETIHPEWLDEMVSHAVRPEIGAVGAKLFYPNFRIQHAGVITGLGGIAGHVFRGLPRDEPGLKYRPHMVQNFSVVTAACLVIRKSVYLEAGGFNEHQLQVAYNDVDFCLKVQSLGYRNLYTPFAELLHHESASRGADDTPEKRRRFEQEVEFIKARWGERLLNDPAYNPNFSLDNEDFALAYPPRLPPLAGS